MSPVIKPPAPQSYSKLRAQAMETLGWRMRAAGLKTGQFVGRIPLWFGFEWHEPDSRRDWDGVSAGGRKIILDVLQERHPTKNPYGLGIIHCDGQHCVKGCLKDEIVTDPYDPGVLLMFSGPGDKAKAPWWEITYWLPGVLPDLNQLLQAREVGAVRSVLRRQAQRGRR